MVNNSYGEQCISPSTVPPSLILLADDLESDLSTLLNNSSNVVLATELNRKTKQNIHSMSTSSHAHLRHMLNTEVKTTHAKEFSDTNVLESTGNHINASIDNLNPLQQITIFANNNAKILSNMGLHLYVLHAYLLGLDILLFNV